VTPRWRGVNFTIFSQSTWIAGDPSAGVNYAPADARSIDYFIAKGVNHLRMMFTWEWLQATLQSPLAESEPYLSYWSDLLSAISYSTGHGVAVTIGPYGYSPNFWGPGSGETTPSWRGVGAGNGVSYTNRIGGPTVTNTDFADLWTRLATAFLGDPLVSFDLINEPHHLPTLDWFATAQHTIDAIRATGSTASILLPGNGFASYDVAATYSDTGNPRRSNAYGWANANGPGLPLTDPLQQLIAECHLYLDDAGGTTLAINGFRGGSPVDAARDRLAVMVDWARPLGLPVHVGEIGWYAGTLGAQATWDTFVAYCDANADVVVGYDWWAASEPGWWDDPTNAHFSVSPTTAGADAFTGDTVNMIMIETAFTAAPPSADPTYLPTAYDQFGFFHLDSGVSNYVGYRPDTYRDDTPISLLVWMHGCGGQAEGDLWSIAPPATRAAQSYLAISLGGRDGACWQVNVDAPKIFAAIADVSRHFNVDPRRIFLGGYSSGGDMAYRHGFENAGLFAGILAENSDPFRDTGSTAADLLAAASWPITIGQVAHLSDEEYPIATVRASFELLQAQGYPATLIERPGHHYDPDDEAGGTNYDLIHSLLPFLDLGWTSPA
jgi:predicted esterase/aryl-phospho-beta-D-glucosidase BglC (GH1 family)